MPDLEDDIKNVGRKALDKFSTVALTALGVGSAMALNKLVELLFQKFVSIENALLAQLVYTITLIAAFILLSLKFAKEEPKQSVSKDDKKDSDELSKTKGE